MCASLSGLTIQGTIAGSQIRRKFGWNWSESSEKLQVIICDLLREYKVSRLWTRSKGITWITGPHRGVTYRLESPKEAFSDLYSSLFTLITSLLYCRYHLYTDDLQIYLHSPPDSLNDCVMKLNTELLAILNWSSSFGLNLNPFKSQAILLGQQRLLTTIDMSILPNIVINNVTIPYTSSVLNLEPSLDSNLNWQTNEAYM